MKFLSNKQYEKLRAEIESEVRAAAVADYPPLSDNTGWSNYLSGLGVSSSPIEALRIAAVFRCVDLGSRTMAALPLHMFETTNNGKERAKNHPLYNIVYVQPNRYTTAYEFWQMFFANLMLTRGGFAKIERNRNGFVTALWNIPTTAVSDIQFNTENGERYIYVTDAYGNVETLHEGEFLYVPGFRFDSDISPRNPVELAGKVLGLTSSLNSFAAKSFSGALPGGYVEYPSSLSDAAYKRFKEDFEQNYYGVANSGKWMFLEQGAVAKRWENDMEKSQVLESRKFAIAEVCRVFGIPPHLCMDMEHATFSNIEQQSLEFVRDFVNPMCVRTEQALFRDLLTEQEKKRFYFKFNVTGLLRGDTAARSAFYSAARQNGWISANEIRELEDMNSLGEEGDIVYINGNMLPLNNARFNAPKSMTNAVANLEKGEKT